MSLAPNAPFGYSSAKMNQLMTVGSDATYDVSHKLRRFHLKAVPSWQVSSNPEQVGSVRKVKFVLRQ